MECSNVRSKPSFGFDLEKAGDIRFRKVGHLGMGGERPFQRQPYDTVTLTNAGGIQMIADFAPDQFRIGCQRIERERDRKRLLDFQRTVGSADHQAVEAAAVERDPQQAGKPLAFQFVQIK